MFSPNPALPLDPAYEHCQVPTTNALTTVDGTSKVPFTSPHPIQEKIHVHDSETFRPPPLSVITMKKWR